jgi:hypothetical protein
MAGNQKTIEVDKSVYERFEERRQGTQNEHVPAMSESTLLSSLLDTVEAVDQGYYETAEDPQDDG